MFDRFDDPMPRARAEDGFTVVGLPGLAFFTVCALGVQPAPTRKPNLFSGA